MKGGRQARERKLLAKNDLIDITSALVLRSRCKLSYLFNDTFFLFETCRYQPPWVTNSMDVSASGAMRSRCVDCCRCFAMVNHTAQTMSASIYPTVQTRASGTISSWWWSSWFLLWYCTWCDRPRFADETIWTSRCRHPTMVPTTDHRHRPSTDASTAKCSVVFVPLKIIIKPFRLSHRSDPSLPIKFMQCIKRPVLTSSDGGIGSNQSRAKAAEHSVAILSFIPTWSSNWYV